MGIMPGAIVSNILIVLPKITQNNPLSGPFLEEQFLPVQTLKVLQTFRVSLQMRENHEITQILQLNPSPLSRLRSSIWRGAGGEVLFLFVS